MSETLAIRVGIIGQGRSGHDIHAAYLKTDPKYRIVAVADPLADRLDLAKQEFGAKGHKDYHDLLKRTDLDLVVNTTPSHLHAASTLEILGAGFACLCEKPLAGSVPEVDRLIAAAKKSKKVLAVFQQNRFAAYFLKVQEVIESGVLGRVVMVKIAFNNFARRWDWQTLQEYGGGSLRNTGPHPVDQALVLFGSGMPEVFCLMDRATTFGDADDHVKLILHGEGHPTIDLEISSCCAYPLYMYQVYGTQGGLTWTGGQMKWRYYNPKTAPPQRLIREPLPGRVYCREKLEWTEQEWTTPPEGEGDSATKRFYDGLHRTLTEGAPLAVTLDDIRRQIAVIEEAHRQNRSRLRPFPPGQS